MNGMISSNRQLQCLSECDDSNGHWPYCLRARNDSDFAAEFGARLSDLHEKLEDESVEIVEYTELLEIFDLQDSECDRSNITIGDESAENDGDSICRVSVELDLVNREAKEGADILIPPSVESEIDRSDSQHVFMKFSSPGESLILNYSNPSLDRYFGGVLSEIISSPNYMILQGPNACTRIPF